MTIAVTGAGGQLGRLVVEALLRREAGPIVAIVRDPAKVADLAARGVAVRPASYDDPAALDAALTGVDRVLLVSGNEFGERVRQHTNLIRAAERAGLELLVYTSIPRAEANPMILAREHAGTEAVLAESTVPHTILRNSWYWENYVAGLPAALEAQGLPAPHARVLADADTGISTGLLHVTSGDLEKLLGHPATPAVEVFRAALARTPHRSRTDPSPAPGADGDFLVGGSPGPHSAGRQDPAAWRAAPR